MREPTIVPDRHRRNLVEGLVLGLAKAMEHGLEAESTSARKGLLQGLDPRIKLVGCLALIFSAVLVRQLTLLAVLFLFAVLLALVSNVSLARLFKQVWLGVLLFTGVIALPAIVVVPGTPVWHIPLLHWQVTEQGLRSAAFLIGRAETSATFALLLILSTPWPHVLKAMRTLGVPVVLVAILGMTHRYIFVLLHSALQMFEARRSRIVAPMAGGQRRRLVAATAGVLLGKAFQLSSEVHLAMISRGYRGEIHLLDDFRTRPRDWVALTCALALPVLIIWNQT
ncbi:MAG: cobalt ECF transporter T component CbiQ [Gallionellaceae bacterium]|nr:cobalt ECF transporter T component CbiQ [Gallionellaceae bacterium]